MAEWRTSHAEPATKPVCKFQGGAGLEEKYREKYRPTLPCLGKFERSSPNQKYCKNCRPFARKLQQARAANAAYQANPKKLAKRSRENRWKRKKAAGRPCRRLGSMAPCEYRDERGKRGKGCLRKFKRETSFQKFCVVCQKYANADTARRSRKAHLTEIRRKDKLRRKRQLEMVAQAKSILAEHTDPRITLAVCLELQGVLPYDMKDRLFPDVNRAESSVQRKARHDRVKKLFKRHPEDFERERKRIIMLSEIGRAAEAEKARLKIARYAPAKTRGTNLSP
jgi:hypothetical protein